MAFVIRQTVFSMKYEMNFMFEFPRIISLYYIKNQQDTYLVLNRL